MLETDERGVVSPSRTLILELNAKDDQAGVAVVKALGSGQRLRILDYLQTRVANVSEIAEALNMPLSTANLHLNVLEKSGLIRSEIIGASRGVQKLCARAYDLVLIQLPRSAVPFDKQVRMTMPVGAFTGFQVTPTCGLATENGIIGYLDDPISFYEPERFHAQLIWFRQGYLEYHFPHRAEPGRSPKSLQISMEICSEAPNHHQAWPSDIFMEINGREIGVWTSPGDFGGERGQLTPRWWDEWNSQYGLLKTWRVDGSGSWLDGTALSGVTIDQLGLAGQPYVRVRVGIREDAHHKGGLNLFGRHFGNYPQDILLQIHY